MQDFINFLILRYGESVYLYPIALVAAIILSTAIVNFSFQSTFVTDKAKNITDSIKAREKLRLIQKRMEKKRIGVTQEKGLYAKIEKKIRSSNIKRYIPAFNSEMALLFVSTISLCLSIILYIIFKSPIITIIGLIFPSIFLFGIIEIMTRINHKKINANLITFLNLMAAYSSSFDDIIKILNLTAQQMPEPLRSQMEECCIKARTSGDTTEALQDLSTQIEHEKMNEIIINLEFGSRFTANYKEMIETLRRDVQKYLQQEEEITQMKRNSKTVWLILVFIGGICVKAIQSMGTDSILTALTASTTGFTILSCLFIGFVYLIIQFIKD